MSRQNISSKTAFEAQIGYSRAVRIANWVLVSGCTGYDYSAMRMAGSDLKGGAVSAADRTAAQAEQAMQNVSAALQQAGAMMADVVRVTYTLPERDEFEACWPVLRKWFGDVRPAATMVEAGLMNGEMRFEVEVTAFVADGKRPDGLADGSVMGWGVWSVVGFMLLGWLSTFWRG